MLKNHGFKFSWKILTFSYDRNFKNNWFGKVQQILSVQRWWLKNDIRETSFRVFLQK